MIDLQQFDVIEATFTPRRSDDLKVEGVCPVGSRIAWDVSWVIEDDRPYAGEWACVPRYAQQVVRWVPSGDLSDIRIMQTPADEVERARP